MECSDVCECLCAYLDGELDSKRVRSVEEHLGRCSFCKRELDLQKSIKFLVQEQFLVTTAPKGLRQRVVFELARADEYRESGIQALDLIRWGTHIAQFYRDKNELTEVLVPYMEKGLEQNELCVWVTSEMSKEEAIGSLAVKIPGVREYMKEGQLQILSHKDWFLPEGCFDCQCSLNNSMKKYDEAISGGYDGLRITGDLVWLGPSDWECFMDYENHLDNIIHDSKLLAICVYKETSTL